MDLNLCSLYRFIFSGSKGVGRGHLMPPSITLINERQERERMDEILAGVNGDKRSEIR